MEGIRDREVLCTLNSVTLSGCILRSCALVSEPRGSRLSRVRFSVISWHLANRPCDCNMEQAVEHRHPQANPSGAHHTLGCS